MNLGQGKIAVWKGDDGTPHAVSASCTHKGCTRDMEQCGPNLGLSLSRLHLLAEGSVIYGPAVEPLPPKKFPPNWLR